MVKAFFRLSVLFMSTIFAEAITLENVSAFETPATWSITYAPWHSKAVESHKTFCALTHANEGDKYAKYTEGMALNNVATWVSSLENLPVQIDKHRPSSDVMTTMVLDLALHRFDVQLIEEVEIILAKSHQQRSDWLRVESVSTGVSESNLNKMFNDVFIDTSNQYEFLVAYKHNKPVASAVVYYQGLYASVYWVSTIPSERRQGFGSLIMTNALKRIRQRNIRCVILQAQPMGERLYRNLGFIPLGYLARY